jgi:hypothetical protein
MYCFVREGPCHVCIIIDIVLLPLLYSSQNLQNRNLGNLQESTLTMALIAASVIVTEAEMDPALTEMVKSAPFRDIEHQPKFCSGVNPQFPSVAAREHISLHGPELDAAIRNESYVCATCSEADFTSVLCERPGGTIKSITRSTLGETFTKTTCPSCRLITRYILSLPYADKMPSTTCVGFGLIKSSFVGRNAKDPIIKHAEDVKQPHYLEIYTCASVQDIEVSWGPGSILPINSNNILPFATAGYDGPMYARQLPETADIELLKKWMRFCQGSHKVCKSKTPSIGEAIQVRFIDVRERCLVNSSIRESYVALSYVWGKSTNGVLTIGTIDKFYSQGSLTEDAVPHVVFDAMELTASLGEHYLWVDTVCIIQDDINDKQQQLPVMDAIFGYASLTIIAAVEKADARLPRWAIGEGQRVTPSHTETLNGVEFTISQPSLALALSQTKWNERGWTFQEGLLARRALIFTDYQVYWNCLEESWCEDQQTEFQDLRHMPTDQNSILTSHYSKETMDGITALCALGVYLQIVNQYVRRDFSDDIDVFWAFLGIPKILKDRFPRGYIWGLPYDYLDAALLWYNSCPIRLKERYILPIGNGDYSRLLIPSWCWIGQGKGVRYGECLGAAIVSRVRWHEPFRYTGDYDLATGNTEFQEDIRPSAFVGLGAPSLETGLLDFALLHFTAETASLELKEAPNAKKLKGDCLIRTKILLPSGEEIGEIRVPDDILSTCCRSAQVDFILLSIDTGERARPSGIVDDAFQTQHMPRANIMLIEWLKTKTGNPVAVRVGLTTIDESGWNKVETVKKEIVLS